MTYMTHTLYSMFTFKLTSAKCHLLPCSPFLLHNFLPLSKASLTQPVSLLSKVWNLTPTKFQSISSDQMCYRRYGQPKDPYYWRACHPARCSTLWQFFHLPHFSTRIRRGFQSCMSDYVSLLYEQKEI